MFRTELLQKKGKNNRNILVTLATLVSGETLQVTAVNIQKKSLTATPTAAQYDQVSVSKIPLAPSPIDVHFINPTTVESNIDGIETKKSRTKLKKDTESDQSLSESEYNDVYIKPLKKLPAQSLLMPASPTVDQLIGSLNLERFRPVFNVMAELLQKNIVNRQTETKQNMNDLSLVRKTPNTNFSTQNKLDGQPVYIPLQIPDPHTNIQHNNNKLNSNSLSNFKLDLNNSNINLNRLTSYSLHINPPESEAQPDFPDGAIDYSWQRQQNSNSSQPYIEEARPHLEYGNSLLNNGIPIRPGEIINANADVIFGRPNGIGVQYLRQNAVFNSQSDSDLSIEYTNQSSTNYNVPPFKKKTWIPPQIPLSLTPPRIIPVGVGSMDYNRDQLKASRNQHRVLVNDYDNILRPPTRQAPQIYPEFSTPPSYPGGKSRLPGIYNSPNNNGNGHLYGSQQLIANLNSELNNNEILELKQIPQIFSTQLPTMTTYPISDSKYYKQISPKISAHHHINLKTDVLNHNVNINVPPLTFKSDSDNFPFATALRGHIAAPHMPLIKIPLNKANVEVRLTPQNTKLAVKVAETAYEHMHDSNIIKQTGNIFKQRNQNFFKNTESSTISGPNASFNSKTISSNIPTTNLLFSSNPEILSPAQIKPQNVNNKWNFSETFTKWNAQSDTTQVASNSIISDNNKHDKGTLNDSGEPNLQDQNAEYTTYNSNYNLPNENISLGDSVFLSEPENLTKQNIHLQSTNNAKLANASSVSAWLSFAPFQTISLGQPFIKSKQTQNQTKKVPNDLPKKVFVAAGEQFNLRAQLQPKQEYSLPLLTSPNPMEDTVMETKIFPTILLPPPLATLLKTTISTFIYGTGAEQSVVGLQPPPILASQPTPSTLTAQDIFDRYTPSRVKSQKNIEVSSIFNEPITHKPTTTKLTIRATKLSSRVTSLKDIDVSSILQEPITNKPTTTQLTTKATRLSSTATSPKDIEVSSTFKEPSRYITLVTKGKAVPTTVTKSNQTPVSSIFNESKNVENFKPFPSVTKRINVVQPQIPNTFHIINLYTTQALSHMTEPPTVTESVLTTYSILKKIKQTITNSSLDSLLKSTNTFHNYDDAKYNSDLITYNNSKNSLFLLESSEPVFSSSTKIAIENMNSNTFSNKITDILNNEIVMKTTSIFSKFFKSTSSRAILKRFLRVQLKMKY
ncbi:putative uncharacterized protein DDB_G0277255 [Drosophila hydei]|uniref:Uncharacterized protein n=1 Tax=Drosophila hydei TaxID=7224 RepID=A0A6J1LEZ1_DROHY|nr:putative uncharacterized protein DDB_G0277255 [Drosophila hydei]